MSADPVAASSVSVAAPTSQEVGCRLLHVPASVPRPSAPIVLAPNDWVLPYASNIQMLFFYSLPEGWTEPAERFMDAQRMGDALERLLAHYPLLGGSLQRNESDSTLEVSPALDQAVPFVTAESTVRLGELPLLPGQFTSTRALPPSLKLVHAFPWGSPLSGPVFAVQHTRFACGGVGLGVHLHHYVADADSFFGLVRNWAELYRDPEASSLKNPPALDRGSFVPSAEEISARLAGHVEPAYYVPDESAKPKTWMAGAKSVARVWRFEGAELARIKAAATAPGGWVSTFEALTAHLHRLVYAARHPELLQGATGASPTAGADAPVPVLKLNIATNWRPRLHNPPVPPNYFGNGALYSACHIADPRALLLSQPLSAAAAVIHDAIQANDEKQLRGTMAWIASQGDKAKIQANMELTVDFAITAWHKFGMYECAEFEPAALPLRVSLPHIPGMDGIAILFGTAPAPATAAAAGAECAIDVCLGLEEEAMKRFEANPEFRMYRA